MVDFVMMGIFAVILVIVSVVVFVIATRRAKGNTPGAESWAEAQANDLPIVINADMDGAAFFETASKEPGAPIFNEKDPSKIIADRATYDTSPLQTLENHRFLLKASASASTETVGEMQDTLLVCDEVKKNPETYPLMSSLTDSEILGCLPGGHDDETLRSLMGFHCRVEKKYFDTVQNKMIERDVKTIEEMESAKVAEYMAEIKRFKLNCKYIPHRDGYVDIARAVNATQMRFAINFLQALINYLESYYSKMQQPIEDKFWKGVALGVIGGGIAVFVLGGFLKI